MMQICFVGWNLFIVFPVFIYRSVSACQPPPSATFAQPPLLYDFDAGQQQQAHFYQYGVSPQDQPIQSPPYPQVQPQFSGLINGVNVASPIVENYNNNNNVDLNDGSAGESEDFSIPTTSSAFIQENADLPSSDDERVQTFIGVGVNASSSAEALPPNDGNRVAERWRANGAPTIPIVDNGQRNGFGILSVADQTKRIVYPFGQANVAQVSKQAYYGIQNQQRPSAQHHPQLVLHQQPQLLPPTAQNPHLPASSFGGGASYLPPWQQQYGRKQVPTNQQLSTPPLSFGGWNLYAQPNFVPPPQPTALWPQQQFPAQQDDFQQQQEVQPSVDNSEERSLETGNLSRVCPDASATNALIECLNIDDEPFQQSRSFGGDGEDDDDNDASMLLRRPLRGTELRRCAFDTAVEPTCSLKSMTNEAAQFYRASLHKSGDDVGFIARETRPVTFNEQFARLMGRNYRSDGSDSTVPTGGFLLVLFDEPRVSGESATVVANFEPQKNRTVDAGGFPLHRQPSRDAVLRTEIGGQRGDGTLSFKYWTNAADRISVKVCARMPFERHCTSRLSMLSDPSERGKEPTDRSNECHTQNGEISYTSDTSHVDVQVVNPLPVDRQRNGRFAVELIVSRRVLESAVTSNEDRQPLLFILDDVQYDARYFEEEPGSPSTQAVGGAVPSLSSLQLLRRKLLGSEARYHPVKVLSVGDVDVKSREEVREHHRRARLLHAKQSSHRLGSIIPLSKDHHGSSAMVETTVTDEAPPAATSTKPTSFWQLKIRKLKTYSDMSPAKDVEVDLSEDGPRKTVDLKPIEFAYRPVTDNNVGSPQKPLVNPLRYKPIKPSIVTTTVDTLSEAFVDSTISDFTTSISEEISSAKETTTVSATEQRENPSRSIAITTKTYIPTTVNEIIVNNDVATINDVTIEPATLTTESSGSKMFVPASAVTTSAITSPMYENLENFTLNLHTNDIYSDHSVVSSAPRYTVEKSADDWSLSEQGRPDVESRQMSVCETLSCDFVNSTCHYVQRSRRESFANDGLKHGNWQLSRCTSGDEEPTVDNSFVRCAMNRIGLSRRSDDVENAADTRKSPILRHAADTYGTLIAALAVGHDEDDERNNFGGGGDALKKRGSNVAAWWRQRRSSTSRVGRVVYVLESAEFQLDEDGQLVFDLYKRSNAISLRVCLDAEQRKCVYESRELNARHYWRRGERVDIPKHTRKIFFIATQWKRAKWLALANIRLERGSVCTITTTHQK